MLYPRFRLYRVILVLIRIYLRTWVINLVKAFISKERYRRFLKRTNQKSAFLLYNTIIKLQGLFIKVGQFMSLRVDLLPRAYTGTLAKLQDQIPPVDYKFIEVRLKEELEEDFEDVFASFNAHPIAAASLGQVHEAILRKDSRRVAVKIQYPGIERIVETDLKILRLILWWFGRFRREFKGDTILKEFEWAVRSELDYIHEGKNAERVKSNFPEGSRVYVPEVIWEYTTPRVLVLEYIEGIKVTDVERLKERGYSITEVSKLVVDSYFKQLFKDGFFQADAHPGNLFILPGLRLGLLDFGLAKELSAGFRRGFTRMALSVIRRDEEGLARAFQDLGFITANNNPDAFIEFSNFVVAHTREFLYRNPRKIDFQGIFNEITDIVKRNPIVQIPNDFILIGRVMGQLSGLGRQLKARIKVDELAIHYLGGAVQNFG